MTPVDATAGNGTRFREARLLLVDDEEANLRLLRRILEGGGWSNIATTTDPTEVLGLCREERPDLLVMDLMMPRMSGAEVLGQLRSSLPGFEYLPVLVATSDPSRAAMATALGSGADDYLTKPLGHREVRLRVANLLRTRSLHLELREMNRTLEERVRERTADLQEARIEILERLALAAEYRDDDTGEHTRRVGRAAAALAGELGLAEERVRHLRRAAPLHDVGKIGIGDSILLKPGRLTAEEFEVMKTHTRIGARLLSGSRFPVLRLAESIALRHHENWDGSGYPGGVAGEAIPLGARIVAVVDVFDSLTHERVYRSAIPEAEALALVRRLSGEKFDPEVVEAFLSLKARGGDRPSERDAPA